MDLADSFTREVRAVNGLEKINGNLQIVLTPQYNYDGASKNNYHMCRMNSLKVIIGNKIQN